MTARFIATSHQIRRYRATVAALLVVLSVAFWPSLLLPLARQYVEFKFRHPGATPLTRITHPMSSPPSSSG